jgi:Phosphotransferase enzyme family
MTTAPHPPLEAALPFGAVAAREPLPHEGQSGATLERVTLTDGNRLVLKHATVGGDWLSRASNDDGREARLWLNGTLDRLPPNVETAIVAAECDESGYVLAMRDVSDALLQTGPIDRATTRRLFLAVAAVHREFAGSVPDGLLSLQDRLRIPAPATLREEDAPIPRAILAGWRRLAAHAPRDVADAVAAIHADPTDLARDLARGKLTLVHGDFRPANLGVAQDTVIVLDWSIAGPAPPELELPWMLLTTPASTEEDVIEEFRSASGDLLDEARLRLAILAGLAHVGCHATGAKLDWWIERAREAL